MALTSYLVTRPNFGRTQQTLTVVELSMSTVTFLGSVETNTTTSLGSCSGSVDPGNYLFVLFIVDAGYESLAPPDTDGIYGLDQSFKWLGAAWV